MSLVPLGWIVFTRQNCQIHLFLSDIWWYLDFFFSFDLFWDINELFTYKFTYLWIFKKKVYFNPYFLGDLAFMRFFFHLPPYIRGSNKYFSKWDCLPNSYLFEKDSHQISSTHKYLLVLGIHFKKLLFICVYFKWVINIQFLKSMPSTHI